MSVSGIRRILTGLCVLAVAGMIVEWVTGDRTVLRYLIWTASCAYLLVAALAPRRRFAAFGLNLIALLFCWLGDILGPGNFMVGVVMFLIAHLALVPAFFALGVDWRRLPLTAGSAAVVGVGIAVWLGPAIPEAQRPLIYGYSAVISLMLGVALSTYSGSRRWIVPVAAVLFYLSDLCLAQTAFLDRGIAFTILGYPMYYAACLTFAWSPPGVKPEETGG